MDELRWTELAAHVVAWHNRHPLARRIGVQHVQSLGYVMLPFAAAASAASAASAAAAATTRATPDGPQPLPPEAMTGSLRERAMARAQLQETAQEPAHPHSAAAHTPVQPAFDEDFIPPHAPRTVRRWAARHAVAQTTPRGDVQVRKVAAVAGLGDHELLPRWVLTAQIEVGNARSRVLVGPGMRPAVLGRRLISPVRGLALLALPVATAGVVAWALSRPPAPPAPVGAQAPVAPVTPAAVALPASAPMPAPAPVPAPVSAPAHTPAAAPAHPSESASTPAPPAASAAHAAHTLPAPAPPPAGSAPAAPERPADVEPRLGRIDLPSLGPVIDERRRRAQAAAASAASAAHTSAAAPKPAAVAPAAAKPSTSTAPPAAAPPAGPSFAVSTRLLRTRSESEQVAAAMRELLSKQSGSAVRVEVLPVGDDWRVVGWPYADRALADKAQALLASRGMKVQVIAF